MATPRLTVRFALALVLLAWTATAPGARARPAAEAPSLPHRTHLPLALRQVSQPCLQPPRLVSPANGAALDTLKLIFTFNPGSSRTTYLRSQLTYANNPAFTNAQSFSRLASNPPAHIQLFQNLAPATTYYWKVHDYCDSGGYGPWSEVYHFTTGSGGVILPAPALTSPISGTVGLGSSVTLTWAAVPGATAYYVHVAKAGSGASTAFWPAGPTVVVDSREPNTAYEWWLEAFNDYAYGASSERWRFTTGSF